MSKICDTCGLPEELCVCEEIARESQEIRIYADKRRYGKVMTIVEGINPQDIDLDKLVKELKNKCACGGTLKEGRVELQGEHRKRVAEVLKEMGFPAEVAP
jgi:translation initiation factor 1